MHDCVRFGQSPRNLIHGRTYPVSNHEMVLLDGHLAMSTMV